jgi:hypothetical protein
VISKISLRFSAFNWFYVHYSSFSPYNFRLRQVLLQSEEELLARRSPELVSEGAAPKSRKTLGKMKIQLEGTAILFLSRPFLLVLLSQNVKACTSLIFLVISQCVN